MKKPETLQDALDLVMRDSFATSALQGMLARPSSSPSTPVPAGCSHKSAEHYAAAAYAFADAMMEARKQ